MTLARRLPLLLIRIYQCCLSPFLGTCCRFEPSCSHYAEQAIAQHGISRGARLTIGRLLRCHPWGKSGFDPVIPPPAGGRG